MTMSRSEIISTATKTYDDFEQAMDAARRIRALADEDMCLMARVVPAPHGDGYRLKVMSAGLYLSMRGLGMSVPGFGASAMPGYRRSKATETDVFGGYRKFQRRHSAARRPRAGAFEGYHS